MAIRYIETVIAADFGADVAGNEKDRDIRLLFPDRHHEVAAIAAREGDIDDQELDGATGSFESVQCLLKISRDAYGVPVGFQSLAGDDEIGFFVVDQKNSYFLCFHTLIRVTSVGFPTGRWIGGTQTSSQP